MNEIRDKIAALIARDINPTDRVAPDDYELADAILALPEIADALKLREEVAEIRVIDLANLRPKDLED